MNRTCTLMVVVSCIMMVICGCGGVEQSRTGFLSDYSNLKTASNDGFRYMDERALNKYSAFIVDEVKVHFFEGASAIEAKSKGKISEQDIKDLANYFQTAIIKAISDSGGNVVNQAGPGVARIRVALTDIKETGALNVLPQASLLGTGIGSAAMEAEIVDSKTGKQIGAAIELRKGSRVPFSNLGDWATAKSVMDYWAKRFSDRLN